MVSQNVVPYLGQDNPDEQLNIYLNALRLKPSTFIHSLFRMIEHLLQGRSLEYEVAPA